MVAIHTPRVDVPAQADPAGWAGVPPGGGQALPAQSPGSVRTRPGRVPLGPRTARRHLPDRATRVRRRRLAVLVGAVVLVAGSAGVVQIVGSLSGVSRSPGPEPLDRRLTPAADRSYVVKQGDTLWSIAQSVAPGSDPRPVVDALRKANGGPTLKVGTRLTLDVGQG